MSTNTEPDDADAQPESTAETSPDISQDPNQDPELEDTVEAEAEVVPEPEVESEEPVESEVEPGVDDADSGADTVVQDDPEPEDAEEEPESVVEEDADAEAEEESGNGISGPPAQFETAIKGGELKDFVSTLRAIVDEAKITVSPDAITTRAVDPANVAMFDIELSAAAFESYDATEGILGINLDRLEEVLKLANKGDLVQLAFDPATRKLGIHIDGVDFTMACIDPDSIRAEPDIPNMDLPVSLTLDEAFLSRGVTAADMVADHIRLRFTEDSRTFHVEAEGDTDDVSLELTEDDISVVTAGEASALFSLDYLEKFARAIPNTSEVALTLGVDFPLLLEYGIADGDGSVLAMLAPRISTS